MSAFCSSLFGCAIVFLIGQVCGQDGYGGNNGGYGGNDGGYGGDDDGYGGYGISNGGYGRQGYGPNNDDILQRYLDRLSRDTDALEDRLDDLFLRGYDGGHERVDFCSLHDNIMDFFSCVLLPVWRPDEPQVRRIKINFEHPYDQTPAVGVAVSGVGTVLMGSVKVEAENVTPYGFEIVVTGSFPGLPYFVEISYGVGPRKAPASEIIKGNRPVLIRYGYGNSYGSSSGGYPAYNGPVILPPGPSYGRTEPSYGNAPSPPSYTAPSPPSYTAPSPPSYKAPAPAPTSAPYKAPSPAPSYSRPSPPPPSKPSAPLYSRPSPIPAPKDAGYQ